MPEPTSVLLQRIRAQLAVIPAEVSLVDELIAERRDEAHREASGVSADNR